MSDVPNDPDRLRRAERANAIMNDPLVVEAFETLRIGIFDSWEKSPARDIEGQTRLHDFIQMMNTFQQFFAKVIDEGKMQRHQLEQLRRGQL